MSASANGPAKVMVYKDYLQLDKILGAQERESEFHDEHFFIIVHQVYELWFKAIIFELKSVMETLKEEEEKFVKLNRVNEKMTRIIEIQKILVDQLLLLDTLNPAEFMKFRGYLFPASGFQSYQFRIFENTFGLKKSDRSDFGCKHYRDDHPKEITVQIDKSEEEPTLLTVVESWLERVFEQEKEDAAKFWPKFEKGVNDQIEDIKKKFDDDVKDKDVDMKEKRANAGAVWSSVIDESIHNDKQNNGERKMSFKAWQGAIMITYLRNQKEKYAQAYRFINLIRDADNMFMRWRANHVLMVHRQIGNKSGTAGTSGLAYLKSTNTDQYRVFRDLFDFHGFLLDPKYLPEYYEE